MKKFKVNHNYKKILSYSVVILWMTLIFYLSSQPVHQSNGLSKKVTKVIVETAEKVAPTVKINHGKANHIIRKNAHFFTYLVLGILIMYILRLSKMNMVKCTILALIFCILYAISDEVHQLFVPGRGAQLKDVVIDTAGAMTGIILYRLKN
ncbi:VanZ family protein [Tissierella praeacuta]|uniref:VanZ family protein n=1 Tax=Tissierella praeacuta TaxID=43131 RepID=UPI00334290F6